MKRDLLMYEKRLHVFHVHMCVCGRECEDDIVNHVAVCDVVEELGETTCYICVCVCGRERLHVFLNICVHIQDIIGQDIEEVRRRFTRQITGPMAREPAEVMLMLARIVSKCVVVRCSVVVCCSV